MKHDLPTLVLYHNDADGFGSAYALYKAGFVNATYQPIDYGYPFPDIAEDIKQIIIVDFSFPEDVCDRLDAEYELKVIDHHKTTKWLMSKSYGVYDTHYSGAVLTWNAFVRTRVPLILRYVQDRDLWKWELERSKEVNHGLEVVPRTFEAWDTIDINKVYTDGKAIIADRLNSLIRIEQSMRIYDDAFGNKVGVVPSIVHQSEIGSYLLSQHPEINCAVVFYPKTVGGVDVFGISIRSRGDVDVSVIALQYGGGGHKAAAGFSVVTLDEYLKL